MNGSVTLSHGVLQPERIRPVTQDERQSIHPDNIFRSPSAAVMFVSLRQHHAPDHKGYTYRLPVRDLVVPSIVWWWEVTVA